MMLCYGSVSVHPSITSWCSIKMAKHSVMQMMLHDSPWSLFFWYLPDNPESVVLWYLHGTPESLVFWCQRLWWNSSGVIPTGGTKTCGVGKNCDFWQITHHVSKVVQDRRIISMKGEWDVVCTVSNVDIADDLNWSQSPQIIPMFMFLVFVHICGTAKVSVVKLCTRIGYVTY